jgi:beta-glucanase (GH16 family)
MIERSAADWIDPETPFEARITQPYNIHLKPIPSQAPTSTKKPSPPARLTVVPRRKFPTSRPTSSPAPTQSFQPSAEPSSQPSELPTFVPRDFVLVFSDEFNTPNRTFEDGNDPRWTALDKNDYTNGALHYYSPENAVTSADGHLVITSEAADTEIIGFDDVKLQRRHDTKHFRSAMLQSWNKFCFTGGIIEAEVILPGKWNVGGLWPAFWLLGNLARHTYVGSSEHIWPWSSVVCTKKSGWAQKISGCHSVAHYGTFVNEDRALWERFEKIISSISWRQD